MPTPFVRSNVVRLLFVDLDGTIVHRTDEVSPRTIQALNRARDAGCTIVICTGRSRFEVEPVAAQWAGHGYAITNNGAVISEWDTGRVVPNFVEDRDNPGRWMSKERAAFVDLVRRDVDPDGLFRRAIWPPRAPARCRARSCRNGWPRWA